MNNNFSITVWLRQVIMELAKPAPFGFNETITDTDAKELLRVLVERNFNQEMAERAWDNIFLKPRTYGKKQFHLADLFPADDTIPVNTHLHIVRRLQRELHVTRTALARNQRTTQPQTAQNDNQNELPDMISMRREMFELQEQTERLSKAVQRAEQENNVQLRKLTNALLYIKRKGLLEDFMNNAVTQPAHQEVIAVNYEDNGTTLLA